MESIPFAIDLLDFILEVSPVAFFVIHHLLSCAAEGGNANLQQLPTKEISMIIQFQWFFYE